MRRTVVAVLLIACAPSAWGDAPARAIGVLAREGEHDTRARWGATADYLAERVPGHSFTVVPLRQEALSRAVERGTVEFVLTGPGHYVALAVAHGVRCLATLQRASQGGVHSTAGGVILVRADRNDIVWMSDLKGKSFMAVSRESFAGFQLPWLELRAHDIDPFHDVSRLVFSGFPAERVVEAVRDGKIDAAAVRTDVLTRMADEGAVDLKDFRVLHPRATTQHPVVRSTDLYPEWAFAATRQVPDELATRVAAALQEMPAGHGAAQAGRHAGWSAPLDYQSVHEVLRDLNLPPYDDVGHLTLIDIAHRHWLWLIAATALLVVLIGTTAYTLRRNAWLKTSKSALERARAAEAELAHAGRLAAMGEMSTALAHELNQPLTAIVNYASGSLRRLQAGNLDQADLATVLERIAAEGHRSAEIIRRARDFLRKRKSAHEPADVNGIVREAVDLAGLKAHRKNVSVSLELGESLPPVVVDAVQIEQVIVNLVHNAVEAIDESNSARRAVTVATQRNPRKGVDVTVSDTGPGVPEDDVDRLCDPFVSTKRDGMGMGLSISRSIVEAHGDRLRTVPNAAGGAAFRFTLPETEPQP